MTKVDHSPASPAGDLNSLSAGATAYAGYCSAIENDPDRQPVLMKRWADLSLNARECWAAAERASAALAAPAAPRKGPTEEEIARAIHPEAFLAGSPDYYGPDETLSWNSAAQRVALKKAQAVAALFSRDGGQTRTVGDDEDDAEINRILAMSEGELRAELIAEGHDPDEMVRKERLGLDGLMRLAADRERWRSEAASWRRVAERLEEEKGGLREALKPFALALIVPADRGETQAVGDGWQPISTAPRDGSIVVLWKDGWGDPSPAYWGLAARAYSEVATKRHPWTFLDETNGLNGFEDGSEGPTHWRPLPKPPTPDQNRGEPDQGGAITEAGR